jgi:hypothetical protein
MNNQTKYVILPQSELEPGIIYLIQPAELVGTNRFKIGCSGNTSLDRCRHGYKKGSRYICIMECVKPFALEKNIIKDFNEKFKLIAGKEYYEGNELSMITLFHKNVMDHRNNDDILNVREERKVEEIFKKNTIDTDEHVIIKKIKNIIIENDDEINSNKNSDKKIIKVNKKINNKYMCKKCNKCFRDNYDLNKHANKKNSCVKQNIITKNISHKKHALIEEVDNENELQCKICEKEFSSKYSLKKHVKNNCKEKKRSDKEKNNILRKQVDEKNKEIDEKNKEIDEKNILLIEHKKDIKINNMKKKIKKLNNIIYDKKN